MSAELVVVSGAVMTKGLLGILIPLGIENFVSATQATYLYNLISVSIILFIAAMSGPRSEAAFCIVVPIFAGIFEWFGWLRLATPSQTQSLIVMTVIMGVFGVMLYMNDQNKQNYGTIGPGSKVFNIAIFLMMFSAALTFATGLSIIPVGPTQPIPGTCSVGLTCDQFNNIDFTTTTASLTKAGGLDIGNAAGWMVENGLKFGIILINMMVGIFFLPVVLTQTMNGVFPGIGANAAWVLFMGVLWVVIIVIYVVGFYEFFTKAPAGSTV